MTPRHQTCFKRPARSGFTLIEMIGVLAIIGILAAVVAPRVIETIRDAKVTSAVSSVNSSKSAALNYYQRYDVFMTNAEAKAATVPATVNLPSGMAAYRNFGDILQYQEGLVEAMKLPIGKVKQGAANATWMIGCAGIGSDGKGALDTSPGSATLSYDSSTRGAVAFKSANKCTLVLYYYIPALTLQQAASLSTKVNGPFPNTVQGDQAIVDLTLDGKMTGASQAWYEGANVFFKESTDFPGFYDAWMYISHI